MQMFTDSSFDIFEIEGLDARMSAIRKSIQPIFQDLDEFFMETLEPKLNKELYIHIAQHRRRSVYPPESTWSALSTMKRGYKMQPHFQLGINQHYVFMWLSYIDQPNNEQEMATVLLDSPQLFTPLTDKFVISKDHTVDKTEKLSDETLLPILNRWRNVKKGEFQIGRLIYRDDALLNDPEMARHFMLETYLQLLPIYQATILL